MADDVGLLNRIRHFGRSAEAGLFAGRQFLVAVAPPAALGRIPFVPGGLAPVAVARVVALDEVRQVLVAHRLLLERVVDVGAVVVVPDHLRSRVRAGFAVVEENHVSLDALGMEHAGRQAQYRVQVGVFRELPADGFARAALEQHVVRNDRGGASGGLEHRADVLHEIELLVRGARPEVLTVVGEVVAYEVSPSLICQSPYLSPSI